MDESYSESDISLSPSQILERLQVLRQLQLLQRGKLQKQQLEYQETNENSSSITEIVSHFSNSTSYNTFRSLLQTAQDASRNASPLTQTSDITPNVKEQDLLEGISVLNLSEESEFVINSPTSTKSRNSATLKEKEVIETSLNRSNEGKLIPKKQISLDEMPILSPKKDFEALVLEKLQRENNVSKVKTVKNDKLPAAAQSKPFLRRGEGMARFGLNKKDLKIQNTKSLPWRQRRLTEDNNIKKIVANSSIKSFKNKKTEVAVQIISTKSEVISPNSTIEKLQDDKIENKSKKISPLCIKTNEQNKELLRTGIQQSNINRKDMSLAGLSKTPNLLKLPQGKHPLQSNKGQTWASILSKEQNDFLMQLKQSNYYKNFVSPAKSMVSDISCEENVVSQEKEKAEQNMFDLLESKVSHESFNLETSFFNRFLRKNNLEYSGESTPLILQKCLANNPDLLHISPDLNHESNKDTHLNTCSEYTECCSDVCSSVSSCCSCKTIEPKNDTKINEKNSKEVEINKLPRKKIEQSNNEKHQDVNVTETDIMKANIAEMNAKLIATSELLKDRLRELEDEIDTFRKENANLTKMRDEIELDKQKFYEEKTSFEQKFNEEKILSEYYLAEEKEKLTKQKQIYERYVTEMRGKLNKKDKDEVQNLKKEINDLKEEIRVKDAKSTSTIARLRNQIKIMDKENKDLQVQVEKLKKENRRIQHSNEITRRLSNVKYLEQINKKLSNMASKTTQSEVNIDKNMKYKAYEIERQSRSRRVLPNPNINLRTRAKSVPNLNITSRYAKYFSQRDAISQMERNTTLNVEGLDTSDNEDIEYSNVQINLNDSGSTDNHASDSENENNLEKIYIERFQSTSPKSNRSSLNNPRMDTNTINQDRHRPNEITDNFFISKSNSSRETRSTNSQSVSPNLQSSNSSKLNRSKSPISNLSRSQKSSMTVNRNQYSSSENVSNNLGTSSNSLNRSKSPASSFSNPSSFSQKSGTVINKNQQREDLTVSPEASVSRSSITRTNLNPTEIIKPDGSKELRFPNGNIKYMSSDGCYSKFVYYNGDIKENFYKEGRIKYFYAETKTCHTTHPDGLEVLEFPDGQVEKRYKDGSSEIRLPNGSIRYCDPKNKHVREEWRFPDGAALTIAANGEQRIVFGNGQVEVHAKDHKRREFPDGTVKLVYNDGTSETRYASGRVRIKDKHGNLIMDSATG